MSELTIEKIRTDLGVTKARLGEILGLTRQRIDQMQRNGINDNAVSQISEKIAFYKKNGFPMPSGRKIPYLGREITYFPVQVPIIRISNPKAYKKAFTEGDKDLQDTFDIIPFPTNEIKYGNFIAFLFDRDEEMADGSIDSIPKNCLAFGQEIKKDYRYKDLIYKNLVIFTGEKFMTGRLDYYTDGEFTISKLENPKRRHSFRLTEDYQMFEIIKKVL